MNYYQNNKKWISEFLDMLSAHFGDDVEFVVHDLSLDYEHTIVDIRNGKITGRKIGDTGDILGLEVVKGTNQDGNNYNYIHFLPNGKTLRSSTLFLRDENNSPVAAIGINEDITQSVQLEQYLHEKNKFSLEESKPLFTNDVNGMLDSLIASAQMLVGKNTAVMTKEDKLVFLRYLDEHGAFLITRSGQKVCEILNISKFTLYNYLDAIRGAGPESAEK